MQCCSPNFDGGSGWGFFNAIFGWTNSATYGSVISYNLYWLCVIVSFLVMRYREVKGHWPLMKRKDSQLPAADSEPEENSQKSASQAGESSEGKTKARCEVTLVSV